MFSKRPGFGCREDGRGLVQNSHELCEQMIPIFFFFLNHHNWLSGCSHCPWIIRGGTFPPNTSSQGGQKPSSHLVVCMIWSFPQSQYRWHFQPDFVLISTLHLVAEGRKRTPWHLFEEWRSLKKHKGTFFSNTVMRVFKSAGKNRAVWKDISLESALCQNRSSPVKRPPFVLPFLSPHENHLLMKVLADTSPAPANGVKIGFPQTTEGWENEEYV